MSEKVKNRGWVKNVAIIFLAVMLVLTFFSNTIMNRSLPEVTGQSVQPGTITTQVRGDGRIEAAETYEVKSADSRKVQSVPVSTRYLRVSRRHAGGPRRGGQRGAEERPGRP